MVEFMPCFTTIRKNPCGKTTKKAKQNTVLGLTPAVSTRPRFQPCPRPRISGRQATPGVMAEWAEVASAVGADGPVPAAGTRGDRCELPPTVLGSRDGSGLLVLESGARGWRRTAAGSRGAGGRGDIAPERTGAGGTRRHSGRARGGGGVTVLRPCCGEMLSVFQAEMSPLCSLSEAHGARRPLAGPPRRLAP